MGHVPAPKIREAFVYVKKTKNRKRKKQNKTEIRKSRLMCEKAEKRHQQFAECYKH